MQLSKRFFSPLPSNDDLDPKDSVSEDRGPVNSDSSDSANDADVPDETEHKSFKTSLRDALQDWSNDDARDIAEDDSTPMRSGL